MHSILRYFAKLSFIHAFINSLQGGLQSCFESVPIVLGFFSLSPHRTQLKNYCLSPCTIFRTTPPTSSTSDLNVRNTLKFPTMELEFPVRCLLLNSNIRRRLTFASTDYLSTVWSCLNISLMCTVSDAAFPSEFLISTLSHF
jgi:hypothetical protein